MNGIEKITQRIAAEAQAEKEAVLQDAEKRCDAVKAEYQEKAEELYAQTVKKGKDEIEQYLLREDRAEKLNARKEVLTEKQALVGTVFGKVRERLAGMSEDDYVSFLARLAAKASVSGKESIELSGKDAAGIGEKVAEAANAILRAEGKTAELTLSENEGPASGGLILREGNIEVNCSTDILLEQSRSELEAGLAGILFG